MSAQHHDVVVVGGGNAGISLAARLLRDGCRDLALVEPSPVHRYRPLLSYVGSGLAELADLERPQADVVPDGCRWYADRVTGVDPDGSRVRLAGGGELSYTDLVVCPGSEVDWEAVPGSRDAVATPYAATNYVTELAAKTWSLMSALTRGTAVFSVADGQVPCAPVGLKPLFTAADHWRRQGVLPAVTVELVVQADHLVGHARADRELRAAAERYGVHVRTGTTVESVDIHTRELHLRTPTGEERLHYDAWHLTPPHRAPSWVADSGLAGPASGGFLAVDPRTLQHLAYPRVWGLGDVADADAMPSGGALRKQAPVVADNIAAARLGRPLRHYDGYTVAPVTTSRRRLVLAEFDRAGRPEPSVPFPDLARPRASTFFFDRYLQPGLYWHQILKGHVS